MDYEKCKNLPPRPIDYWQPRANLKKLFNNDGISLDRMETVQEFCEKFFVEESYVISYLKHLQHLKYVKAIKHTQRNTNKKVTDNKTHHDYQWEELVLNGGINKLLVSELNKYLKHYNLMTNCKKNDKLKMITCHVMRNIANPTEEGHSVEESPNTDSSDDDTIIAEVFSEISDSSSSDSFIGYSSCGSFDMDNDGYASY